MKITEAAIVVTTKCNMRCPKCFLGIPERKQADVPLNRLIEISKELRGVTAIHITGGEPTLHDDFIVLGQALRDASGAKRVILDTNAANPDHVGLSHYDEIYVSQYWPGMWPGYQGNVSSCDVLRRNAGALITEKVVIGQITDMVHLPRRTVGGGKPCHRHGLGLVLVFEDLVYPCCAPPVVPGANIKGVPLFDNPEWRKQVEEIVPPCDKCRFAVE